MLCYLLHGIKSTRCGQLRLLGPVNSSFWWNSWCRHKRSPWWEVLTTSISPISALPPVDLTHCLVSYPSVAWVVLKLNSENMLHFLKVMTWGSPGMLLWSENDIGMQAWGLRCWLKITQPAHKSKNVMLENISSYFGFCHQERESSNHGWQQYC